MSVTYYLWNESFSSPQSASVTDLKSRCREFALLVELVADKCQIAKASLSVYAQEIMPGMELADWLYGDDIQAADEQSLLRLAFEQQITGVEEAEYENAFALVGADTRTALIGLFEVRPFAVPDWLCLFTTEHWHQTNRFFLESVQSRGKFEEYMTEVFSELCFSPHVLDSLRDLEPFEDYVSDITKHLSILNDYAKVCFSEAGYSQPALNQHT